MDRAERALYRAAADVLASRDAVVRRSAERLRTVEVTSIWGWNMAENISSRDGPLVEGARTVEAAAGRFTDRIVSGAEERLEASRGYISENPMGSVLVAVGVGALVGYLLGRRSS